MKETEKKDIYIQLMEDLIGEIIKPKTPILQSAAAKADASENAKKLDDALKRSCDEFVKNLGIDKITVGSSSDDTEGYIEPCPIQYTGNISDGKIFHSVFIGLNPHLEPHRLFPIDTTIADLANFHHPNNIFYNCPTDRYAPNGEEKKIGEMKNNYWRVFGHMEYGEKWNYYYRQVILMHLALMSDNIKIKKFTDWNKSDDLTYFFLEELKKHPILNLEPVPYKSTNFSIKEFKNIFDENEKKYNTEFAKKYRKYFYDMMHFIDEHSTDDAYIIATASVSGKNGKTMFDALYEILKKYTDSTSINEDDSFIYNKKTHELKKGRKDNKSYDLSPMYLFRWKKRKVIITSPISGNNNYGWIHRDLSHGWISTIKKYFS